MPLRPSKVFDRTHYVKILNSTSCDRYCGNTAKGSPSEMQYPCGAKTDSKIWAIYDLNGTCPLGFAYVKELKKCVFTYKNFWNSCTAPSISYVFDGRITWSSFLQVINKLQLNDSIVTVDFDHSTVVSDAWKCASVAGSSSSSSSDTWRTYLSYSRSTLYGWSSNTRYILENGCLRESSYSSYAHRYSVRICVTNPVNRYARSDNDDDDDDDDDSNSTYIAAVNPQTQFCPTNWFDLNGRCYRMSDDRKTIAQAKKTCINESSTISASAKNKSPIWLLDSYGNLIGGDELNESPSGSVVEYVSQWQARLGFFLLDTDPDSGNESLSVLDK